MASPLFSYLDMVKLEVAHNNARKRITSQRLAPEITKMVTEIANHIRNKNNDIMEELKNDMLSKTSSCRSAEALAFQFVSYDFSKLFSPSTTMKYKAHAKSFEYAVVQAYRVHCKESDVFEMSHSDLMWVIWKYTDFQTRLLKELELDPEHFRFKKHYQPLHDYARLFQHDPEVNEYINSIYLVYTH